MPRRSCARARRASAPSSTMRRTRSSCRTSNCNVVDVNRQACESLGYSREELIGMHPRDFDAALDEASIARLAERVGAGETVTFETLHRRKDGTVFPVEIRTGTFQQARAALLPGARARHQRAQARGGDAAGKGQCAADGADGACPRVAADDAGRADHLDRPRGQPAAGRDGRERRRLRALARSRAARDGGSARGARQHRRRRQAGARGHRANPRAHEAPGAAHGAARHQSQDSAKSSRSRSTSCAATTSCCGPSSPRRCRAWRAIACSCSRCCST